MREAADREYLLGTDREELRRLETQHRTWQPDAEALWERAGFTSGHRLLDLGCGPGFASIDLAHIVGPNGLVLAVDESRRFIDFLEAEKSRLDLGQVQPRLQRAEELSLEGLELDGAFARWLFCFLPEPEPVVGRVAAGLRVGGVLAVQDYFHYSGLRLAPRSQAFDRVVGAVEESWHRSGGDLDIGSRLPGMLLRHGLRIREIRPVAHLARPGSPFWDWPRNFFFGYVPRLVEGGLLTAEDRNAFEQEWAERERDPAAFLFTPPMIALIGEKERS